MIYKRKNDIIDDVRYLQNRAYHQNAIQHPKPVPDPSISKTFSLKIIHQLHHSKRREINTGKKSVDNYTNSPSHTHFSPTQGDIPEIRNIFRLPKQPFLSFISASYVFQTVEQFWQRNSVNHALRLVQ